MKLTPNTLFSVSTKPIAKGSDVAEDEVEGEEDEIRFTPQMISITNNSWTNILVNATGGRNSRDLLTGSTKYFDL